MSEAPLSLVPLPSSARPPAALSQEEASGAIAQAFQILARNSKSFALASKALPPHAREEAAVVYSWCRRVDDAVDLARTPAEAREALAREREWVEALYEDAPLESPLLLAFRSVIRRRRIPKQILLELLEGMQMDVDGHIYASVDSLLLYCFRVAGTVGVMMSHVLGVTHPGALRHASHLGIAMQLTNICRDVREDWELGRLYLPDALLAEEGLGHLRGERGGPLARTYGPRLARVVARVLGMAERYYRSGDEGLVALSWRAAWAVGAARAVYSEIGHVLARRGWDVFGGRAIVSPGRKAVLLLGAGLGTLLQLPRRLLRPFNPCILPDKVSPDELIHL